VTVLPPLSDRNLVSPAHLLKGRNAPARADHATLSEVFADSAADAGVTGFVMAQLHHANDSDKPVLWIQDRLSRREAGRPYLRGLGLRISILYVAVSKPVDALWAIEEGLGCSGLSAVVGEIWGDPQSLDFTATKRIALRAEARDTPTWIMRRAATPNLSAARMRWRVSSLPSALEPDDQRSPGAPLWKAELFRARWDTPGEWVASYGAEGINLSHGVADPPAPVAITG